MGLRPTPGRVPHGPKDLPFASLSVEGPMGRTVGDVALFLDTQAGQNPIDPISFAAPDIPYIKAADNPIAPAKIGYSHDLGIAPVDQEVRDICASSMRIFESAGSVISEAHPDLSDAEDIFQTLRAAQFAASYKKHLDLSLIHI